MPGPSTFLVFLLPIFSISAVLETADLPLRTRQKFENNQNRILPKNNRESEHETEQEDHHRPAVPKIGLSYQQYVNRYKSDRLRNQQQSNIYRAFIYSQNLKAINEHNQDPTRTYEQGLNYFADLTHDEFRYRFLNPVIQISARRRLLAEKLLENNTDSDWTEPGNQTIDWRKNYATKVYSQGFCGSGYVIAVVDAIQIGLKIRKEFWSQFSIQEILSCGRNDESIFGCRGGTLEAVYLYIYEKGVWSSLAYPLSSDLRVEQTCQVLNFSSTGPIKKYFLPTKPVSLAPRDCKSVVQVLKVQPVSVAIRALKLSFYKGGTFTIKKDEKGDLNHAVTLVGYDPVNGYLIKNSWGDKWGLEGYGYVSRETGICEIAVYAPLAPEEKFELEKPVK